MERTEKQRNGNSGGETQKEEFKCFFCGRTHTAGEICHELQDRMKEIYARQRERSHILASILLECIKQDVCLEKCLYELTCMKVMVEGKGQREWLGINIDDIVDYFAFILQCPVRQFFCAEKEILNDLLDLAENDISWDSGYFSGDGNGTADISGVAYGLNDICKGTFEIERIVNTSKEGYRYIFTYSPNIFVWPIIYGNRRIEPRFLFPISLVEMESGALKEIFDSNFDWESAAIRTPISDSWCSSWVKRLKYATVGNQIIWNKVAGKNESAYSTDYELNRICIRVSKEQSKVRLRFAIHFWEGDAIKCIYDDGYDEDSDYFGKMTDTDIALQKSNVKLIMQLQEVIETSVNERERGEYINHLPERYFTGLDTLQVVSSMIPQDEMHGMKMYKGIIPIKDKLGNIQEYVAQCGYSYGVGFCMFVSDYEELIKIGTPVCHLFGVKEKAVEKKTVQKKEIASDEYDSVDKTQVVNQQSLLKARAIFWKNQERLVVDEEDEVRDSKSEEHMDTYTNQERALLNILLQREQVSERLSKLMDQGIAPNVLIENINNKALELIGDILIDESGVVPEIIEDYIKYCKGELG